MRIEFEGEAAVLIIARDLTHYRRLEAQLHVSDRLAAVGTLAGGMAHELNNPLAYVRSNLEFVLEEFSDLADRFGRLVRRFPNVAGGATGFPDVEARLRELHEAMAGIAETGQGPAEQIASMGCSIKWRAA